jgi:hypothetical protein
LIALLGLAAATVSGTLLLSLFDERPSLWARLCAGLAIGMAGWGLVAFVWASFLGLTPLTLVLTSLVGLLPLALLRPAPRRARLRRDLGDAWRVVGRRPLRALALVVAALALVTVFERAMYEDGQGLWTGDDQNLGDLPFHLSIVVGFTHGENLPPEHPELAGARLTYPFLIDFVAAVLVRSGASFRQALAWQNALLAVALLGLILHWATRLTGSEAAGGLSVALVFLNGGLGWLRLAKEVGASDRGLLALLAELPHNYTLSDSWLRWGNAVVVLLITQRAFLLGLPLVLAAWRLLGDALEVEDAHEGERLAMGAGLATGLLPLSHSHSFLVFGALTAGMAALSWRRWRLWLRFGVTALLLAVPQVLWLSYGSSMQAGRFLAWHVGWDHGAHNVVAFWLVNTGAFIPLLLAALAWPRLVPARALRLLAPACLLFIVPNLCSLSPWIWDNIKFLYYWYVASVPLVALLIVRLWQFKNPAARTAVVVLVLSLTLAGALDQWRIASRAARQRIFDTAGLVFAEKVRAAVPPRSRIAYWPTYNHPILLTGRRSLLGYPGHIPSQGLDAGTRESDIRDMYAGGVWADGLIARYAIDYLALGPMERRELKPNESYLRKFPRVVRSGEWELLDTRALHDAQH